MDVTVYNHIDLSYMETMADGDDSMKKVMLDMLVEELPLEIEKLETFCNSADWQEANAVSHKLKSTLAFVGNEEMTSHNRQIEQATKDEADLDAIITWVQRLKSICPKVMEELQQEAAKF